MRATWVRLNSTVSLFNIYFTTILVLICVNLNKTTFILLYCKTNILIFFSLIIKTTYNYLTSLIVIKKS